MSDETTPEGWTLAAYIAHNEVIRAADQRFEDERDRRYTEVNIEKEKALKIKETADLAALQLARESQAYKEQQNDTLRDKSLRDSGIYATNEGVTHAINELRSSFTDALKPLVDFVSGQKSGSSATKATWSTIYMVVIATSAVVSGIYFAFKP
jgi:hypothetical protein